MTYFKDKLNKSKSFLFYIILTLSKTASNLLNKCIYALQFSNDPYIISQHKKETAIINEKLISSRSVNFFS